jgi:hypothetical protein
MRLRNYPYIVLRIACRECPRIGRYRLAVLAERFGADAETNGPSRHPVAPASILKGGFGAARISRTFRAGRDFAVRQLASRTACSGTGAIMSDETLSPSEAARRFGHQ